MANIECDEIACKHNEGGSCEARWVEVVNLECVAYEPDPEKEGQ